MFKSIFAKYFTVLSAIITVSFAAMGGLQMLLSTRYWVSKNSNCSRKTPEHVADSLAVHQRRGKHHRFIPVFKPCCQNHRLVFFITGTDGAILLYSDNAEVVLKKPVFRSR